MEVLTKPAQITARVPAVREQKALRKKARKSIEEDNELDIIPEPWEESRDRGFSLLYEPHSTKHTPEQTTRQRPKLSVDARAPTKKKRAYKS